MTLASAQVIDATAARLATVPAVQGQAYTSRAWPLTKLPAWLVVGGPERVEKLGTAFGARQKHTLQIFAKGVVRATQDLDDAMHALAEAGLPTLFGTAEDQRLLPLVGVTLALDSIERAMAGDGESAHGQITLVLRATFFTLESNPSQLV